MIQTLTIDQIRIDGDTQSRVELDSAATAEFRAAMAEGAKFPPVTVFYDGTNYWLADGFHRVLAIGEGGKVQADVKKGSQKDAQWFSCASNKSHGIRRTNEDKRKAARMALTLHPEMSNRALADHVGVSDPFIMEVRQVLTVSTSTPSGNPRLDIGQTGESQPAAVRTGRDGKKYPVPTSPPKAKKTKEEVLAEAPRDPRKVIIPPHAQKHMAEAAEIETMMQHVSAIRSWVKRKQDEKARVFGRFPFSEVITNLSNVYNNLDAAQPWCVCPMCAGHGTDDLCKGSGVLSKFAFDRFVPSNLKQKKEKQ